jgi:hypothetical protein
MRLCLPLFSLCLFLQLEVVSSVSSQQPDDHKADEDASSNLSRRMAATGARSTQPSNPRLKRSTYPSQDPHICLAFLSCCGRTDLLNHTLHGAIRHMEQDEPDSLRYEIAWVDNGSGPALTQPILDSFQIEHALPLPHNMGLAYGMNLLIHNLCSAPYILLLEEDWLYLDELVAPQSEERKRVIATSVALLETLASQNTTAYDGRNIMGVFLRAETYESFLKFPYADVWESESVNLEQQLAAKSSSEERSCSSSISTDTTITTSTDMDTNVDYRIFCADTGLNGDFIWGSYTNGAGLYRRSDLKQIGRMYGEPGDSFHDRFVEGNYAYRAALKNCHAAVRLTDDRSCTNIVEVKCAGAFHHIGGGRGTRPMTAVGSKCTDETWNYYGTPLFEKFHKMAASMGNPIPRCSGEEIKELRDRKFRDSDAEEYREQVKEMNKQVFEEERAEREKIKVQANHILNYLETDPDGLRKFVPWMADMTVSEIEAAANRMIGLADSAHPLQGYWDMHGRVVNKK